MNIEKILFVLAMWLGFPVFFHIAGALYELVTGYTRYTMDKIQGHYLGGTTYYYLVWSEENFISKYVPNFVKKYFWFVLRATGGLEYGIYKVASRDKHPAWLLWDIGLPLLTGYLVVSQVLASWVYIAVALLIYCLRVFTRIYGWELSKFSLNSHTAFDAALATFILVTYLTYCYTTSLWLLVPVYGVIGIAIVWKLFTTPVKIYK